MINSYKSVTSYSSKNPYGNKTLNVNEIYIERSYSSKNPYGNKTINQTDEKMVGLILAKIHMVTKPQIHVTIYSKIIKY